jgi:hypothetical protein
MLKLSGATVTSAPPSRFAQQTAPPDYTIDIAPYELDVAPRQPVETIAYNRHVPSLFLRLKKDRPVTMMLATRPPRAKWFTGAASFLPPQVDAAKEGSTPLISGGGQTRYPFTPRPTGFRGITLTSSQGRRRSLNLLR